MSQDTGTGTADEIQDTRAYWLEIIEKMRMMQPGRLEAIEDQYGIKIADRPLHEWPIYVFWNSLRGDRRIALDAPVHVDQTVTPRLDYGRWIVDCPYCASASHATDLFFCLECLNRGPDLRGGNGGFWIKVEWPHSAEMRAMEVAHIHEGKTD